MITSNKFTLNRVMENGGALQIVSKLPINENFKLSNLFLNNSASYDEMLAHIQ